MSMGNSLLTLSQWCKSFDSTAKVQTPHMIGRKIEHPRIGVDWRYGTHLLSDERVPSSPLEEMSMVQSGGVPPRGRLGYMLLPGKYLLGFHSQLTQSPSAGENL